MKADAIGKDETGLKHKDFMHVCQQLGADHLGAGETVSVWPHSVSVDGKPLILGYALSISSERLEDAADGIVYLITARGGLRLFKTLDAVAAYLGDNGIGNFKVCTVL